MERLGRECTWRCLCWLLAGSWVPRIVTGPFSFFTTSAKLKLKHRQPIKPRGSQHQERLVAMPRTTTADATGEDLASALKKLSGQISIVFIGSCRISIYPAGSSMKNTICFKQNICLPKKGSHVHTIARPLERFTNYLEMAMHTSQKP